MAGIAKLAADMPTTDAGGTIAGGTPVRVGPGSEPWRKQETYRPGEPFLVERPAATPVPPFTVDAERGLESRYPGFGGSFRDDMEVNEQERVRDWIAAGERGAERARRVRPK